MLLFFPVFSNKVYLRPEYATLRHLSLQNVKMIIASDWSVITLDKAIPYVWIKAVRRLDAVEIFYSFDDKEYTLMRNAWLQDNIPVQVGFMAACPDGKGFNVTFEHFKVKHLPDQRRLEWLKKNAE